MARVEGRAGRPGTTVWADVEIEGRSTGDLPSEPTMYALTHLGHAPAPAPAPDLPLVQGSLAD